MPLIKAKAHFNRAAAACKTAFVAQVAHQEETAATALFETLRASRVGHVTGIETWPFIADAYGKGVFFAAQGNRDIFVVVAAIAVEDGVGHRLGEANEDVSMNVGREVVAFGYRVYKRLDLADILGMARQS